MIRNILAALLALTVAAPAFANDEPIALDGVWETTDGGLTVSFDEGWTWPLAGVLPVGDFRFADGVLTLIASDDNALCPGAVGVYQLSQPEAGVISMSRVSDECASRGESLDGSSWTKSSNGRLIIAT